MKQERDCNCNDCVLAENGPLALVAKWLSENWMLFPPAMLLALDFFKGDFLNGFLDLTWIGIIVLLLKITKKLENNGPWY